MAVTGPGVVGGRYVLAEVLGAGGMATVWRARDEVLGREVAVKVLSPQCGADRGFVARFGREARNAARLSHPRLVTVFDCGTGDGTAFIVMELVAGRTLRQVLDQAGALPRVRRWRSRRRCARGWRWRTPPGWCTATSSPPTSCCRAGR
jgi:eukaryotic-like serine/threonine-protein kinase